MNNRRAEIDRREFRKRQKKTQRTIAIMLIVFFLLSLAFATVSAALAVRVHSLDQKVAGLEEQLAQEQKKTASNSQSSTQDPPVGAGGADKGTSLEPESGNASSAVQPSGESTSEPATKEKATKATKATKESTEATEETTEKKETSDTSWAEKEIYLTFDDGPSGHTDKILELLADYDAKATFFVIGRTDENSKKMYQRIVDEGHTLAVHSYTHSYKQIYASVDAFASDFMKLSDLLYDVTGKRPTISRFPGGSSNKVSKLGIDPFIKYLNKQGIVYFDWNVETGDATGKPYTADELTENALIGIEKFKRPVVLMHDTDAKQVTLESLPGLLSAISEKGGRMLALDETVTPVQHVKADSVK